MSTPEVLEQGSLFGPAQPISSPAELLAEVTRAARDFRACPLWEIGTQTVFGSGSSRRCRAALQPDPIHLPGREVRP